MKPTPAEQTRADRASMTTAGLIHAETKTVGDIIYKAKIRLDDQCKNGHEDFSATIDHGTEREHRTGNASGGCAHEVIIEHFPHLKPFCDLHLSDAQGAPMHAAANGFYWYAGTQPDAAVLMDYNPTTGSGAKTPEQCRQILKSHLRCTDADLAAIQERNPRTQAEFSHALETLGFRARWRKEAEAAIRQLEELTGQRFASKATRQQWEPLTPEQVHAIEERRASGYYTPEATAARAQAELEAKRAKRIAEIENDRAREIEKIENKHLVAMYFARRGMNRPNVIFYGHTKELCWNWTSTERLWTREEFDAFTQTMEFSELPAGVTVRFQEKPRY